MQKEKHGLAIFYATNGAAWVLDILPHPGNISRTTDRVAREGPEGGGGWGVLER